MWLDWFGLEVISRANNNSSACFPKSLHHFYLGQDLQYSENRSAGISISVFFLVLDMVSYSFSSRYNICHRFLEYNFDRVKEILV